MSSKLPNSQAKPPELRRPGPRKHRIERALAVYEDHVRLANPGLSVEHVTAEAEKLLIDLQRVHPLAPAQFEKTAPTSHCPDRKGLNAKIEVAAMRSVPQAKALEDLLLNHAQGRPANRQLHVAIFECNTWMRGRAEVRCHRQDFLGSDALLDWAFDYPVGPSGEQIRGESSTYETFQAMLERHDPQTTIAFNLDAIRELAKTHPGIGRYVVVDGTDFTAPVEQRPPLMESEEKLLFRGMNIRLHSHANGKFWVGWTLLQLTDVSSTLPLVWAVLPLIKGREFMGVPYLLELLFDLWPDCPIEYLIGDREFDVADLNDELEFRYGIHPVWPMRGSHAKDNQWVKTDGVPRCAHHGLMKLEWPENFFTPRRRLAEGIRLGDIDDGLKRARLRWRCTESSCQVRATTYPRRNPRLYTFLPFRGDDHWRVGLRYALLQHRNSVESVISSAKGCGVGLRGLSHPRWVSSDRQAEWLAGATLLGLTLRRLAHESGAYAKAKDMAVRRGLIKGF